MVLLLGEINRNVISFPILQKNPRHLGQLKQLENIENIEYMTRSSSYLANVFGYAPQYVRMNKIYYILQ